MTKEHDKEIKELKEFVVELAMKIDRIEEFLSTLTSFGEIKTEDRRVEEADLIRQARNLMEYHGEITTSRLMRTLDIGYNHAADLMDKIVAMGFAEDYNPEREERTVLNEKDDIEDSSS